MGLLASIKLHKGSLREIISNAKAVNTNAIFKNTEVGQSLYFDTTADLDGLGIFLGVKTIVFAINPTANTKLFLDNNVDRLEITGGNYSGTGLTENTVKTFDTAKTNTDVATFNKWQMVISEFSAGINFATDLEIDPTAAIYLGYEILLYDAILTDDEKDDLFIKFLHSFPEALPRKSGSTKSEIIDSTFIAAYNFTEGDDDTDISGNDNPIVNNGAIITPDGKRYDGVNNKGVIGNLSNIKGVEFRIKLDSTTEQIMEGAANDKLIHVSGGTLTYPEFDNAYIDGVDANTMVADKWHNVVIMSTTDVDFSACTLALNNASYGGFEIADLKFFNIPGLTEANALAYAKIEHNKWARKIIIRETFVDVGADEVVKDIINTNKGTGDFFCGEITTPTTLHKAGDNYIECDSNGTIKYALNELNQFLNKGFVNKMLFYTSGAWADFGGVTVDAAIAANAWLSWSNNELVFTAVAGERIGEFIIQQGEEQ